MPAGTIYQLDANVILRFLRNDHKDLSPRAAAFIQQAENGKFTLEVSATTVQGRFFLYAQERVQSGSEDFGTIGGDFGDARIFIWPRPRRGADSGRVGAVQKANVDFGHAYLAAAAARTGTTTASFDRDFDKFTDIKRHEPPDPRRITAASWWPTTRG